MPRLRNQVAAVNAGLAEWICNHRYLVPTEAAAGESGMALLIMWEVDHDRAFPSEGGDGLTAGLVGFTRRLLERVARDPRLEWLDSVEMAAPLGPGLAPTHHRRWGLRVMAPGSAEPQGWYEDFVTRWRAYLEMLVCAPGSRPLSQVIPTQLLRVRPGVGQPPLASSQMNQDVASSSRAVVAASDSVEFTGPVAPCPRRSRPSWRRPAGVPTLLAAGQAVQDVASSSGDALLNVVGDDLVLRRSSMSRRSQPLRTQARSDVVDAVEQIPLSRPPEAPEAAAAPAPPTRPPARRPAPRRVAELDAGPPPQRQRTLLGWRRPAAAEAEAHADLGPPRHGRAAQGPPT